MEDGCQESKILTCMAKFKSEVVWCTEKENCRDAAIFGSWRKLCSTVTEIQGSDQRVWGAKKESHSLDPRMNDFLTFMIQSSIFL
jgi:hypothetical protein